MADSPDKATDGNGGDQRSGEPVTGVVIPPEKRGRGRPPGAANRPKPETAPARGQPDPGLDPGVIGDLFVSLAEIGDDLFLLVILNRARSKLTGENFGKFRQEMENIRLGPKDKNLIRSAGIALAKKYTFLCRWGPELVIIIALVQYSARMGNALRNVSALPDLEKPAAIPAKP